MVFEERAEFLREIIKKRDIFKHNMENEQMAEQTILEGIQKMNKPVTEIMEPMSEDIKQMLKEKIDDPLSRTFFIKFNVHKDLPKTITPRDLEVTINPDGYRFNTFKINKRRFTLLLEGKNKTIFEEESEEKFPCTGGLIKLIEGYLMEAPQKSDIANYLNIIRLCKVSKTLRYINTVKDKYHNHPNYSELAEEVSGSSGPDMFPELLTKKFVKNTQDIALQGTNGFSDSMNTSNTFKEPLDPLSLNSSNVPGTSSSGNTRSLENIKYEKPSTHSGEGMFLPDNPLVLFIELRKLLAATKAGHSSRNTQHTHIYNQANAIKKRLMEFGYMTSKKYSKILCKYFECSSNY